MNKVILIISIFLIGCGSMEGGTINIKKRYSNDNNLIKITNEPAGVNCPNGGIRVDSGLDNGDNTAVDSKNVSITNNAILEDGEIDQTKYACNGNTGVVGATGAAGATVVGAAGTSGATGAVGATGAAGTTTVSTNVITSQQISKTSQLSVTSSGDYVGDFVYEDVSSFTLQVYNSNIDAFIYFANTDTTPTINYPFTQQVYFNDPACNGSALVPSTIQKGHKGKFVELSNSANTVITGQPWPESEAYVIDTTTVINYNGIYEFTYTIVGPLVTSTACTQIAGNMNGYPATFTTEVRAIYTSQFEFESKL